MAECDVARVPACPPRAAVLQVPSSALSSPAVSVPRAQREKLMRQALPRGQQQALMGHASPGPCYPQVSSLGKQIVSCCRCCCHHLSGSAGTVLLPRAQGQHAGAAACMFSTRTPFIAF